MRSDTLVPGVDLPAVTDWLAARTELTPPLQVVPITGGYSNLTYRVTDAAGRRFVLRRPPLNSVLATAHDMGREHRIVHALTDSGVPVPPLVGMCDDASVNGAPFYVMHFVEGVVARSAESAALIPTERRAPACQQLVDILARLHRLAPEAVGLGDLGRRENYVARQLRRWLRQVDAMATRDFPLLRDVHAALVERMPEQRSAGIVHGDFRLDNCIVRQDGTVAAVLDWELCTLGEVRADLGILLTYWVEPEDALHPLDDPPTCIGGYATRSELAHGYAAAAEVDVETLDVDYFYAFANWRLACIIEGVYARYQAAAMSEVPGNVERFPETAVSLVERAAAVLNGQSVL